ncbi:MAG: hypothetical protein AAB354_08380 [candidate division KSB1 bacterium]
MRLKQLLFAIACALYIVPAAHAQSVWLDFKFGAFYPTELRGGLYPNLALHKSIDRDGVLKWDIGVGAGYYHRSYRELAYVASGMPNTTSAEQIDFTRKMMPLQIKLTMKISLVELNLPSFPGLGAIARKGMSKTTDLKDIGFLLRPYAARFKITSTEENAALQQSAEREYENWGGGAEVGIYISTVQNVTTTISVLYNRATAERTQLDELNSLSEVDSVGLPTAKKVRLNGYSFMLSMGWGF